MKISEVLAKARELISNGWNQGWYAVDSLNHEVKPSSPTACRFCALGAVQRAASDAGFETFAVRDAANIFLKQHVPTGWSIHGFNDRYDTSQEDVLALFGRAIATAQKEEA